MAIDAIILNGSVQLTGNPSWVNVTGGAAPEGSANYKLLLKLESEDEELVGAPFIDAIAPNEDGTAMFDISGYVDQPMTVQFQYPVSGPVIGYTDKVLSVSVTPGESWIDANGDLNETWGSKSEIFYFAKGGVSQRQLGMWQGLQTFYEIYVAGKKWLTLRPWGDFVHVNQPVKLYFLSPEETTLIFEVKYYFNDGTSGTYTANAALKQEGLHEFNCNPKLLGEDIEPSEGKRVTHFDARLKSGSTSYTNVFRFTYDWTFCERPFFLMFANSIAGVDDVYLSGLAEENFQTDGTVVTKPAKYGDTELEPTLIVPNRKGRNSWIISTGWKTKSQMRHLRDLMLSRQVYLLYPNLSVSNYIVIPVIVEPGEKELVNYKNDLFSMDIEISEAHDNKFAFDNSLY